MCCFFFFQAEDGIRDLVRSRGLGDVYKRQKQVGVSDPAEDEFSNDLGDWTTPFVLLTTGIVSSVGGASITAWIRASTCLLYTSDAADERSSVDLGGRRIIKKKKNR